MFCHPSPPPPAAHTHVCTAVSSFAPTCAQGGHEASTLHTCAHAWAGPHVGSSSGDGGIVTPHVSPPHPPTDLGAETPLNPPPPTPQLHSVPKGGPGAPALREAGGSSGVGGCLGKGGQREFKGGGAAAEGSRGGGIPCLMGGGSWFWGYGREPGLWGGALIYGVVLLALGAER